MTASIAVTGKRRSEVEITSDCLCTDCYMESPCMCKSCGGYESGDCIAECVYYDALLVKEKRGVE